MSDRFSKYRPDQADVDLVADLFTRRWMRWVLAVAALVLVGAGVFLAVAG